MGRGLAATLAVLALLAWDAARLAALEPGEVLDDPVLEARARTLSAEIRCLVCQNQSIDASDAELAREMRVLVRERLVAGDSDAAIKDFLVSRYGDFVLLRPPVKAGTYLLWFGPLALVALILPLVWLFLRRQGQRKSVATATGLSAEEQARLEAILAEGAKDREAPGR